MRSDHSKSRWAGYPRGVTKHGSDQPSPEFRLLQLAPEADVDDLGHISNIAYVRYVQDVATAHSTAVGLPHARYEEMGAVFVVRRHEIDYLSPALGGDELQLRTHVSWFRGATSERQTQILRASDGRELARATTLWAYVAMPSGRPRRIPKEVSDAFYGPPSADRP